MSKFLNFFYLNNQFKIALVLFCMVIHFSCNTSKYLPADKTFLKKNEIRFLKNEKVADKSALKAELQTLYKQRENTKLKPFGINRRVFYYKTIGKENTRFGRWVRKIFSEVPAIYDADLANSTTQSMKFYLQNKGYLNAEVFYDKNASDNKNTEVYYYVSPKQLFTIDTVEYLSKDANILDIVNKTKSKSFIKSGSPLSERNYNLEVDRITRAVRNAGYAGFFANYIKPLTFDTIAAKANVTFEILPPNGNSKHLISKVGQIYIVFSDVLNPDIQNIKDTSISNIHFIGLDEQTNKVNPRTLLERLFIHNNDVYNQSNIERTYTQFDNLRLFRFINIKQSSDSLDAQKINFQINVAMHKRMNLQGTLELNTLQGNNTAGNLFGGGASINHINKNLRGGGEILSTNIEFNTQLLISDGPWRLFSSDGKFQIDYLLPKFKDFYFNGYSKKIAKREFGKNENDKLYKFYRILEDKANTKFSFIVNPFFSRDLVYNRIALSYGFTFPLSSEKRLSYNHIGLDYFAPTRPDESIIPTDVFNNIFRPQLSTAFLLRDIVYQNNKIGSSPNNYIKTRSSIEFSGIELYGINAIYNSITGNEGVFKIPGSKIDYGRYIRLESEWSRGFTLNNSTSFHVRLHGGFAKTFGYEGGVPFARQFFGGGANSIRGWDWRGIGPGEVYIPKKQGSISYQSGDLQLESNAELRFPLFWIFKLATFVDVGNIWNINNRIDSKANFTKDFYKQIAIGSGLGIRMDFGYAMLRLDIGTKLRTPYFNPDSQSHWFYANQRLASDKLVYNLALGYPF